MKKDHPPLKNYFFNSTFYVISGILCCTIALLYHITAQKKLDQLENAALYLKKKEHWTKHQKSLEQKLLQQLKVANRDYVEKEIESIEFLLPEIKKLKALLLSDPKQDLYAKRLQFLTSNQNHLEFKEQNFQRLDHYQEVEITQKHSVEMNREDLKLLLSRIENISLDNYQPSPNPPDLLIKKFELQKKPLSSNEETFVINLELIKYEMAHE